MPELTWGIKTALSDVGLLLIFLHTPSPVAQPESSPSPPNEYLRQEGVEFFKAAGPVSSASKKGTYLPLPHLGPFCSSTRASGLGSSDIGGRRHRPPRTAQQTLRHKGSQPISLICNNIGRPVVCIPETYSTTPPPKAVAFLFSRPGFPFLHLLQSVSSFLLLLPAPPCAYFSDAISSYLPPTPFWMQDTRSLLGFSLFVTAAAAAAAS
ncbi:hypothetical protein CDEST_06584 [Colletotrichum destructivum]|uniref:Uncharacterized protein n=1 Tax=Colletotrichum destructivum TaxID=34406 RepID=A0AAX4IER6_9PEZI|nr:hypothetical protein CDEST_06584 [Colletotrichum destructivum]